MFSCGNCNKTYTRSERLKRAIVLTLEDHRHQLDMLLDEDNYDDDDEKGDDSAASDREEGTDNETETEEVD